MYFLRATSSLDELAMCGCSSGSPPGMVTIGAPHSSTAREALLERRCLLEDVGGVLDLAAAGAGEVAAEQRLEHEDQRIALAAPQLLPQHVGRDGPHLGDRNASSLHAPFRDRSPGRAEVPEVPDGGLATARPPAPASRAAPSAGVQAGADREERDLADGAG